MARSSSELIPEETLEKTFEILKAVAHPVGLIQWIRIYQMKYFFVFQAYCYAKFKDQHAENIYKKNLEEVIFVCQ